MRQLRTRAVDGFKVIASTATGTVVTKLAVRPLHCSHCIDSCKIDPSPQSSPQAVLLQLLQTDDERELAAVQAALAAALQRDAPATLAGLLEAPTDATAADDSAGADSLRSRAVAFLTAQFTTPQRAAELLRRGPDAERVVAALVRRRLAGPAAAAGGAAPVTAAEFALYASILLALDLFRPGGGGGEELLEVRRRADARTVAALWPTKARFQRKAGVRSHGGFRTFLGYAGPPATAPRPPARRRRCGSRRAPPPCSRRAACWHLGSCPAIGRNSTSSHARSRPDNEA